MKIIDLTNYIKNNESSVSNDILEQFHKFGILIVKDPRVSEEDNDSFLDMLENYYQQDEDIILKVNKEDDISYF